MSKTCKLIVPYDYEYVSFGSWGPYRIKLVIGSSITVRSLEEGETNVTVTLIYPIVIAGEKYNVVEFASDNWEIGPSYLICKIDS